MTDDDEIERLENLDEDGSSDTPVRSDDAPRFNAVSTRRQVAIAKYHGMGGDNESWSVSDISDYLNVSERTVKQYIFESDMGKKVEKEIADIEARTRMKIATKLLESLDRIEKLIEEAMEEKRPAVVSYEYREVMGDMELDYDELNVEMEDGAVTAPVPDKWKEVTKTDDLQDLWEERRHIMERLEAMLGLDAPEQIEAERTEVHKEEKVWKFESDDLPEQSVSSEGERRRDDEVIDVDNTAVDSNDDSV